MKTMILALAVAASANGFALTAFPQGSFHGQGRWSDSTGKSGQYSVETKTSANSVASHYRFGSETRDWNFSAAFKQGFFDVMSGGRELGQGYCQSVQCHYQVDFGGGSLEETLTFVDGKLYKVGSKKVSGITISWEEALE